MIARTARVPKTIILDVPYVSQFARAEDAERILRKKLLLSKDPHWALSGAVSRKEYDSWARSICGMACASMIMNFYGISAKRPVELAKEAMTTGVYTYDKAGKVSDMQYRPFVEWLRQYDLWGAIHSRLSVQGLKAALADGKLSVVSVSPTINQPIVTYSGKKGGHLVVVTGYDDVTGELLINNPSGFASSGTQKGYRISERVFSRYFAGRGIVVAKCNE